jgi:cytochrome c biogenesis protein CcmG, thiol:disulfide interchange protein DsbE
VQHNALSGCAMSLLRRRLLRLAPLSAFAISASALFVLLEHRWSASKDDEPISISLVGSAVPEFTLPAIGENTAPRTADLTDAKGPILLNFFASWCSPCLQELPLLLRLRQTGLAIWGVAYRDRPADATAFLRAHGDPYQRLGHDDDGKLGPLFDLIGLPESFLISGGIVRWGWAGGLTEAVSHQALLPLLHPAR